LSLYVNHRKMIRDYEENNKVGLSAASLSNRTKQQKTKSPTPAKKIWR